MRSAVLCYAAADADSARELAHYLELNCGLLVSLNEGRIEPGGDLLEAAGRALSADYPVLLLSPDSSRKLGDRGDWEPVLFKEAEELGRQVAYVLLRACEFPGLFRKKKPFFDLSGNWLAELRKLRQWILQRDPLLQRATNIDELPAATGGPAALIELESLLDRPEVQSGVDRQAALAFAHAHLDDFEGVFWIDCACRSRAGILGDIAHALGLLLRGSLDDNAQRLRAFLSNHRLLLLFEHIEPADAAFVAAGERTSFVFVREQDPPSPTPLDITAALFADWRNRCDACLRSLGHAQWHMRNLNTYDPESRKTAVSPGSTAASFLRDQDRLAEAYEFLEWTKQALRRQGEPFRAARLDWEMSWIREEWGEPVAPRSRMLPAPPVQLSLGLWK